MNVLLVEDDRALANGLQQALTYEHFVVNWVAKGKDALHVIASELPDIVILDMGLPDMDGLQVLQQLRLTQHKLPVLLLTARDSVESKVAGLDAGADDYLTKPFEMLELFARLRMLGRRSQDSVSSTLSIGNVCLDTANHQVHCDQVLVTLSRREYRLLRALMENVGRVQTYDMLESKLYSWGEETSSNTIQVHIHHLRKKLTSDFISTIRGVGYIIKG
jgi:DNA-binding response OmpR family regulator